MFVVDTCAPSIGCMIVGYFLFYDCCKGNIIPQVGRRKGWIILEACELNNNHPKRLSFLSQGFIIFWYCKFSFHHLGKAIFYYILYF